MRVIAKKTLRKFWEKHTDAEQQLKSWYQETSKASWDKPHDLKAEYPSVRIIPDNRAIFNILGNKYRLIIKINYQHRLVWIRFIGTHADYDKIDAIKI